MAATPLSPSSAIGPHPMPNIFSAPLKVKTEAAKALKKKNQTKAGIQLLATLIALGVYSFVFFMPQVNTYLQFNSKLQTINRQIENSDSIIADLEKKRTTEKEIYDNEFKKEQAVLDIVLPPTTDKIGLIRLMEDFATKLSIEKPPFEFTSITFDQPVKKGKYQVLPFQTSISASRENFARFLELISLSGNLDPESKSSIRLMEISNINLNYKGTDPTGKDLGVDFSVKINAYSR